MCGNSCVLIFLVMLVTGAPVLGSTVVSPGNVSGTWTAAGSPYLVEGDISIAASDLLIIEPGVEVNFQGHYGMTVEGTLQAAGAVQDSVVFTAADHETGWKGIGIVADAGPVLLEYCVVQFGTGDMGAGWGGGIYCLSSLLTLRQSRISHNHALYNGGGVYLQDMEGTAIISDCTISSNNAGSMGGGVYLSGLHSKLTGCVVEFNRVSGSNPYNRSGGGLYCWGWFSGSAEITGCTFRRNMARMSGGGLFVEGGLNQGLTIADCDFIENQVDIGDGIGVFITGMSAEVTITGCSFMENWMYGGGGGMGGAIYSNCPGDLTLSYCTFGHNYADGGGTAYFHGGTAAVESCTFSHNYDWGPYNGALVLETDTVVTNTIIASQYYNAGGCPRVSVGINFVSGTHTVRNCDFYDNGEGRDFIGVVPPGLGDLAAVNANGDSCDAYANIFRNPLLCGAPADLTIAEISPCLGAGEAGVDIGALGVGCELSPVPEQTLPGGSLLIRNYPNPFNPQTTISFTVARAQSVKIAVFDLTGKRITVLVDREYDVGDHAVVWRGTDEDGRKVSSGTYLVSMENEAGVQSRKISLVR